MNRLDTLLSKRSDLEAELQEALHDQLFYAEQPDSDSEYLQACKEVDRLTDRLQDLDHMISFFVAPSH